MQISGKAPKSEDNGLYLVGLGSNLISGYKSPLETLIAALAELEARKIKVLARSPWFESEPVPKSDQNWFVNAAICVSTLETPQNLLKMLHEIEIDFGRIRSVPNAARPLDLDLLGFLNCGKPVATARQPSETPYDLSGRSLEMPHPRLAERGFVLRPLQAIAPGWRHPVSGLTVEEMLAGLSETGVVRLLGGGSHVLAATP